MSWDSSAFSKLVSHLEHNSVFTILPCDNEFVLGREQCAVIAYLYMICYSEQHHIAVQMVRNSVHINQHSCIDRNGFILIYPS